MMQGSVLDASAVLALLNQEPGWQAVESHLQKGVISAVNWAEVLTVLVDLGMSQEEAEPVLSGLLLEIVPFDQQQAARAAVLRSSTKKKGLSLGDRACLALAQSQKKIAITADKAWLGVQNTAEILLIR